MSYLVPGTHFSKNDNGRTARTNTPPIVWKLNRGQNVRKASHSHIFLNCVLEYIYGNIKNCVETIRVLELFLKFMATIRRALMCIYIPWNLGEITYRGSPARDVFYYVAPATVQHASGVDSTLVDAAGQAASDRLPNSWLRRERPDADSIIVGKSQNTDNVCTAFASPERRIVQGVTWQAKLVTGHGGTVCAC